MKKPLFIDLFSTFFFLGLGTFGGGLAMLPFIKKQVIEKGWISDRDWDQFLAVIQLTPGALAVNMSHLIGHKVRGWLGGLVAVFGMVFPSLIVISFLSFAFQSWIDHPIFQSIVKGIYLVVIAFLIKAFIDFSRSSYRNIIAWTYGIIAATLLVIGWFNPTFMIASSLFIGFLEWLIRRPR
jgi:chromate transporter